MNKAAALIATGIGGVFFALATAWPYRPSFLKTDASDLLSTNHGKARAAVSRLLLYPATAEFGGLRTVEAEQAKYVCGSVKARDRSGGRGGARAFVYTVASDFARIDDDGQIAQRHASYRPCPGSDEDAVARLPKPAIPPAAMAAAALVQKGMPASDSGVLTSMSSQMSSTAATGAAPGGRITAAGTAVGAPAMRGGESAGQQSQAAFKATVDNENEWRADRPPLAWPVFPAGHALARAGLRRLPKDAIAAARDLETRWAGGRPRPGVTEIQDALRTLMAIDSGSPDYPAAWAAFVRLRRIEREAVS